MLASKTHKFYDSRRDHDEIVSLGVEMKQDELILADEVYREYDLLKIFEEEKDEEYQVSDELYQLLNVLHKNRTNRERLINYIKKNSQGMIKEIDNYIALSSGQK